MDTKKKVLTGFVLTLLSLSQNHSYGQEWEVIYPANIGVRGDLVKAIQTPNENTACFIGNDILRFNNSGDLLSSVNVPLPFQQRKIRANFDIQFISESEARMVFKNNIISSPDTGQTWNESLVLPPVNTSIESSSYFDAIHFPDQNTGYAVGSFEKIFKSVDGGDSWDELSSNPSTAPYIWYTDVFFLNELNGFVSGFEVNDIGQNFGFQAFVLHTGDGGQTWQRNDIATINDYRKSTLDFKTNNTGFVFFSETQQSEKIFVTNDGSQTWTDITPEGVNAIHCVKWSDTMTGLIFAEVNNARVLFKTIDQGQSWNTVPLPVNNNLSENTINDILFLDDMVYAVGIGGGIFFSQDIAETWTIINESNIKVSEIDFTTEDIAYALTGSETYKSEDGGENWNFVADPGIALSGFVIRLDFTTASNGLILGFGNQYLKTTDGLDTFEVGDLPEFFFFANKFISASDDTIYIAGTTNGSFENKLLISNDGGDTWLPEDIGHNGEFVNNLQVLEDGSLVVLTDFIVSHSTDAGATWNTVYTSTEFIQNALFLNAEVGYVYSSDDLSSGQVRKIINDENPTTEIVSIASDAGTTLTGFLPLDEDRLFAYGFKRAGFEQYAVILKSVDAGQSWQEETFSMGIPGNIKEMILTETSVLAFGSQGQILQYSDSILSTSNNVMPDLKMAIYPNPTFDFIRIRHNMNTNLDLKIFTLQGQLLMETGLYQKESVLNLSNLPNGTYVLRVSGDNIHRSKILLKK